MILIKTLPFTRWGLPLPFRAKTRRAPHGGPLSCLSWSIKDMKSTDTGLLELHSPSVLWPKQKKLCVPISKTVTSAKCFCLVYILLFVMFRWKCSRGKWLKEQQIHVLVVISFTIWVLGIFFKECNRIRTVSTHTNTIFSSFFGPRICLKQDQDSSSPQVHVPGDRGVTQPVVSSGFCSELDAWHVSHLCLRLNAQLKVKVLQ